MDSWSEHVLWTFFDAQGEIERQEVYDRGEARPELRRSAPPWYDLAPCFDPSLPVISPDDGEEVLAAPAPLGR